LPSNFFQRRSKDKRIVIGLIGVFQPNFNVPLAKEIFQRTIGSLKKLEEGANIFSINPIPDLLSSPEEVARVTAELRKKVDFLLVQHCTLSRGDLIFPLVEVGAPLGLWAIPEPVPDGPLPLGSLVGMNLYSGIIGSYLEQRRIKFKWFFGEPENKLFLQRFLSTLKALRAIKILKDSRLVMVGGIAPGFYDLYFDERSIREKFGCSVLFCEFSQVLKKASQFPEKEISMVRGQIETEGIRTMIRDEDLEKAARVYLAFEEIAREYDAWGLAIECWPRFNKEMQFVPCSVIGRLNENGIIAACEGDILGALSMFILSVIADCSSTVMDLAGFDSLDDTILFWHCGPTAPSWAEGGKVRYRPHCNIGRNLPQQPFEGSGFVNDLVLKSQPVTIMRLTYGGQKMFLALGNSLGDTKKSYDGSRGWVGNLKVGEAKATALDFVNTIMVHKIEHHFPLVSGHLHDELRELGFWLDVGPLEMVPYRGYMQDPEVGS
jgi:L-fucose isomerase-like protein